MPQVKTKFKTMYLVNHKPNVNSENNKLNNESIVEIKNEDEDKTKSDSNNYNCHLCAEQFSDNKSLEKHIKISHVQPMTFNCSKCSFSTTNFIDYKNHFENNHKINKSSQTEEEEDKIENCKNCNNVEEKSPAVKIKAKKSASPKYYPYPKIDKINRKKSNL